MLAPFPPRPPLLHHRHPHPFLLPITTTHSTPNLVEKRRLLSSKPHCFEHLDTTKLDKATVFGEDERNLRYQVADSGPYSSARSFHVDDHRELARLLQSCSDGGEVRRVHAVLVKNLAKFGDHTTFLCNNLVSGYVRFGMTGDARKVFDGMPDRNVVTWTALLDGYSKMGSEEEFRDFVGMMFGGGVEVEANGLTYVCLLRFCSKALDFELGRQVHGRVVKGGSSNLIVDSTLVCFYAAFGEVTDAFTLFGGMKRWDVVCWTTMITAYTRNGCGSDAFAMFSRMRECGFSPNEFTVCSVLKACGEENVVGFGRQLHAAILKKVYKDDVFVGSSLVGMYVKCNAVDDARAVFDVMPHRNTVTWTSMIAGYVQNGHGEEAIKLFHRMKRRRILANSTTIVSILCACGSIGSLFMGKEVHGQILKNHFHENLHVGSTLVWFYCKCGEYSYAAKVLEAMPTRDVVSWTAIISGHTSTGLGSKALDFLNEMLWEGIEPNPFTYSSSLKACSKIQAIRRGQLIHASISKTCALANVYVGSALISLYMKCRRTNDALRIFKMMPKHNAVSWKAMVVGYAKNGLCREALKLMYQMQAEGLKVDDYVLSIVLSACSDNRWESEYESTILMSE